MKLARYIALIYLGSALLTLLGLTVLVVAATLIENGNTLTRADVSAGGVLELAAYQAVSFAYLFLPAACFLGALVAGTTLARRGELLGIQAAGIGPARVWGSFVAVSLLLATANAGCGELVVPDAVAHLERAQREHLGRADQLTSFYDRRSQWFRRGELVLFLPEVDLSTLTFAVPVVYRFAGGGEVREVIEAETLTHEGGAWLLRQARVLDVATSRQRREERLALALDARPEELIEVTGDPRQMRLGEIRALAERRIRAGFDATSHLIELHTRLSHPLTAVFLFLVCAPWALHPDRRRSLAVSLGLGVVMIAALFSLFYVFRLLALGHDLPAAVGAWALSALCVVALPVSALAYRRYRTH